MYSYLNTNEWKYNGNDTKHTVHLLFEPLQAISTPTVPLEFACLPFFNHLLLPHLKPVKQKRRHFFLFSQCQKAVARKTNVSNCWKFQHSIGSAIAQTELLPTIFVISTCV